MTARNRKGKQIPHIMLQSPVIISTMFDHPISIPGDGYCHQKSNPIHTPDTFELLGAILTEAFQASNQLRKGNVHDACFLLFSGSYVFIDYDFSPASEVVPVVHSFDNFSHILTLYKLGSFKDLCSSIPTRPFKGSLEIFRSHFGGFLYFLLYFLS